MSIEGQKFYPGDDASHLQLLELAAEYHRAAVTLRSEVKRKKPLTGAPYRLAAIHAMELYLNALLRSDGVAPETFRKMGHDLALRVARASAAGLQLKKRTAEHLTALSEAREYIVMRYGPEMCGKFTHLNRVDATLKEVAEKVTRIVMR